MPTHTGPTNEHWNYFLSIERDLETLSRYVELDPRNFACFSIEIAKIVLAAGAEIDVVCKQLCKQLNPQCKAARINAYEDEILIHHPNIPDFQVLLPRFGLTLQPWNEWRFKDRVPFWWTAYNKVKHHRHSHYHAANLENALNAAAGLFVIVLYLYKDKAKFGELLPSPELLSVDQAHKGGFFITGTPAYEL